MCMVTLLGMFEICPQRDDYERGSGKKEKEWSKWLELNVSPHSFSPHGM